MGGKASKATIFRQALGLQALELPPAGVKWNEHRKEHIIATSRTLFRLRSAPCGNMQGIVLFPQGLTTLREPCKRSATFPQKRGRLSKQQLILKLKGSVPLSFPRRGKLSPLATEDG